MPRHTKTSLNLGRTLPKQVCVLTFTMWRSLSQVAAVASLGPCHRFETPACSLHRLREEMGLEDVTAGSPFFYVMSYGAPRGCSFCGAGAQQMDSRPLRNCAAGHCHAAAVHISTARAQLHTGEVCCKLPPWCYRLKAPASTAWVHSSTLLNMFAGRHRAGNGLLEIQ